MTNKWARLERRKDGPTYFATNPVSSLVELQKIISIADKRMAVYVGVPNMSLLFRGQASDSALVPKLIEGRVDIEKLCSALKEMLKICKEEIGDSRTDNEVYFMMRHAGLPSHLIDWSYNWKIALWFALHNSDGTLTNRSSSLWVLQHHISDLRCSFFPADQHTCERSERQEGWAYVIRFEECVDGIHALPMERDCRYEKRLLKIPIDITAHERMERELLTSDRGIVDVMKTPSPLSNGAVEKCHNIFRKKLGLNTAS